MTQLLSARPQPRLITQDIRQSVVEDDSAMITVDGTVTLHGPVNSEKEE